MSVINTSSFAKALWPGINEWYGKEYNEYPVEWTELVEKHSSRRAFEEDVGISSFGLAQVKPEGSPISYDSERQAFITRYVPVVYALGFVVTREMFDDDLYDVVGQKKAKGLAFSMRQTKEIVVANMYNRAFNSSYVGGDAVSMINSAHPLFAGGTASNQLSTAADISEAALEQASIDIQAFTNDRGLLIAARPQKLIITPSQEFEVKRILGSTGRVGTTNNDLNALKTMGIIPEVVVNHFLTDSDAWFIRTNVKDGLKLFERDADEFGMDNDFDTQNAKFMARARYSVGWTDWRAIYGSAGA
jgi:hypothetical protein